MQQTSDEAAHEVTVEKEIERLRNMRFRWFGHKPSNDGKIYKGVISVLVPKALRGIGYVRLNRTSSYRSFALSSRFVTMPKGMEFSDLERGMGIVFRHNGHNSVAEILKVTKNISTKRLGRTLSCNKHEMRERLKWGHTESRDLVYRKTRLWTNWKPPVRAQKHKAKPAQTTPQPN